MELLAKQNGLSMVHSPIKAGPPGYINEMVRGDIHVATINVATAAPMVKAGQLRPLAVNSEQRLPEYPDVPTIAEAGYPGIMTVLWAALFAPAATPHGVLATLQKAVVQALNSSLVQEAYRKQIIRSGPTKSLDDAKSWLAHEIATWKNNTNEVKIDLTD
jgi:tripartite-type tricarboxylate transporter receptor subunit TctC